MNQRPTLLITGASGFTGHHACKHFMEAGFEITAVTRQNLYNHEKIHVEVCDLTNKDHVNSLVKKTKPKYLLHLAGQNNVGSSWSDPVSSLEANSMSTAYLIDALRQENPSCKIIVVGSALQFDPSSMSTLTHPYSLSKTLQVLIAQSWAALYKMPIVIAKPSNLIGPGFSNGVCSIFARKIVDMEEQKSEKVLEVYNLKVQRDFLDVRDAVKAYEILFKNGKPGETYDITSGVSRTLEEVINGFRSLTAVDFKVKSEIDKQIENHSSIIPLKLMNLGWKPSIPIETSLRDIINFHRRKE
ncbi:UDP-2-acetamido-2,6-dideoxy-hexulose 4-reductase [Bacillus sp. FJAT-21352]|nr:UDP-2-acetamido-2,6-dideoxy-hexulose 4-reductase [Bacillus sp. FJAT-21352]